MTHANFVKAARTDIYDCGVEVKADNKKGYRIDRSQPRDKDDQLLVKKGESYYWWQFAFSPYKHISLTPPKPSQLTQSGFWQAVYSIDEDIQSQTFTAESLDDDIDEIVGKIEELRDEQEEKKGNMPDSLQESSTGELLQCRYDSLDQWINDLQAIDLSIDDDLSEEEKETKLEEIVEEIRTTVYNGE